METMVGERQSLKKRGTDRQGIDRGAEIMDKARPKQFRRANSAADFVIGFKNSDGLAGLSYGNRSRKTIGTGTDNNCVVCLRFIHVAAQN